MKTIPIINNKGGVGKTTTSVNVAAGLARRGRRVLLVDLDSQGSASIHLGVPNHDLRPSMADVLLEGTPAREVIRSTGVDTLDLLTGSLDLANADVQLKNVSNRKERLLRALEPVAGDYDHVIVDCAPSTSVLTINALVAGDGFIIPVTASYLALEGVVSLGKVVKRVRRNMGEAAPVLGLLVTCTAEDTDAFSAEENNGADAVTAQLRNHYGAKVFDTEIRQDPALEAAPGHGKDIFAYAPDSSGADDYRALIDEIEDRIDRYGAIYGDLLKKNRSAQSSAGDGSASSAPAGPSGSQAQR
jgi:chromosome partitioning protein